ncbi:HIGH CHLOROPHYLL FLUORESCENCE 153-like protein [Cinnamomum micranthum f. kanehirae]|uniref:HIGH CHLOROPHYLL FLUORESCENCE 153-like protein n=1 Tax=Cinnamomum micranthum f. kanehirae TaxID=337451 RepID=A0A3S4NEK2_9MAGN|nr:HIGH CHLOROPHYLL FLUORESCENCE 153-like protein [Cinnamomum micranthum f. kanehirae]
MLYPNVVSSTPFQTLHHTIQKCPNSDSFLSLCAPSSPAAAKLQFSGLGFVSNTSSSRKRKLVVARAGPPSTTSLIFAFVFPLSLLLVTIFTSIRIADKLDQQYLEELAINEAIMEEEDEEGGGVLPAAKESALPKSRNRPNVKHKLKSLFI